ncbi:MAG: Smr/MutS family protein [Lachnospiraceae bacterium]|nr:Smr/MutS family protein [Lachnospiraceae bacterium]
MLSEPIITIDVHGKNVEKALDAIHKKVDGAGSAVYEVRVIHGFHGGTRIRSAIREEFGYGLERRPNAQRFCMTGTICPRRVASSPFGRDIRRT